VGAVNLTRDSSWLRIGLVSGGTLDTLSKRCPSGIGYAIHHHRETSKRTINRETCRREEVRRVRIRIRVRVIGLGLGSGSGLGLGMNMSKRGGVDSCL